VFVGLGDGAQCPARRPYICMTSRAMRSSRRMREDNAREPKIPALRTAAEAGMVIHLGAEYAAHAPRGFRVQGSGLRV